ncbi:MAG: hypothetical protein M0P71_12010 [Melioribacteraceae bacterium]|jgi:hypothetical protein|nr:hypothetical protein [Melioribacteraceae bacterium]
MPVTNITVSQTNIVGDCNLLAIHSPLVFLIDVTYTGSAPILKCDVNDSSSVLVADDAIFQCIYYRDLAVNIRQFMFVADEILRGYMPDFDDFVQTAESVSQVTNIPLAFELRFYDSLEAQETTVDIIAFAASRQFGQTPALTEMFLNEVDTFICGYEKPVYIYFFNPTDGADIVIQQVEYQIGVKFALDFNAWTGVAPETYPSDCIIAGTSTNPRTTNFRVYEISPGVARFIINEASPRTLLIEYPGYNLNLGGSIGQSFNRIIRVRYKTSAAYTGLFAIGEHRSDDILHYGWTTYNLQNTAGLWVTEDFAWTDLISADTTRYFMIGLSQLAGVETPIVDIDLVTFIGSGASVLIPVREFPLADADLGLYRLKLNDLTADALFRILVNNVVNGELKTVTVKPFCTNNQYIKYLDRTGQYRFFVFNRFYETKDNPKLIGKLNKLITSILDSQSSTKNIGYKNERKMTLIADEVSASELLILSDIYTSPRVLLYIGSTTDENKDWIEVTIDSRDNMVRSRKGGYSKVEIEITLPENYSINML